MKRVTLFFFCLCPLFAFAQKANEKGESFNLKKTVKEIRSYEKADNYTKIHETLQQTFAKWPEAKEVARLWHDEMRAQFELAKADNTKLFLKNKPDTASYFTHVLETYRAGLQCDTLDRRADKRGQVRPRYTRSVGETLTLLRNNLRSGGRYFYLKKRYAEAFSHLDIYLQTIGSPLLLTSSASYTKANEPFDVDSVGIAVLAVMAASQDGNAAGVLKYVDLAECDTAHRATLIYMRAKAHLALEDTAAYYATLHDGFSQYPTEKNFYSPLIDHSNASRDFAHSLELVNRLISCEPRNDIFWALKGKLFEAMELPDSAECVYLHILSMDGKYAEIYASLGNVYVEMAHKAQPRVPVRPGSKSFAANKQAVRKRYLQARKAFEKAMELSPSESSLWRAGLRETYFKLNDGKALKELEKKEAKP